MPVYTRWEKTLPVPDRVTKPVPLLERPAFRWLAGRSKEYKEYIVTHPTYQGTMVKFWEEKFKNKSPMP